MGNLTFPYVEDKVGAIVEAARVLKPGRTVRYVHVRLQGRACRGQLSDGLWR